MKRKDLNLIRQEIYKILNEEKGWVFFDCPNCQHQTIAVKESYVDCQFTTDYDSMISSDKYRRDRRCLVCGRQFLGIKSQVKYVEIVEKKEG